MVVILSLLQFTVILDFMVLSPLGTILMKTMKMQPHQFGSVVSAYAFSAGISGILAAGFADKFDRKKLLMFFYVGFILGTLFCGLANSYETLLAARIFTGVFGGVIGSISMAIVTDVFSLQQRGRVMSFIQMAFAGSQILGLPIGLFLATRFNWHMTFFMIVGLTVLVGIAVMLKMKPLTEHLKLQTQSNPLLHLWNTVQKRDYRIGFMATALLSMGGFMLMPFTTDFIVNNVKISLEDLPTIQVFTGISSMIVMIIIGRVTDRINKMTLFIGGSVVASIMVVIYTNMGPSPMWLVILINMVLFMGIMGRVVPATALSSAVPEMSDRGAYMSVNASLQQMAGGFAAIFAGFIVVKQGEDAPLQNFDVLGYVMLGFIFLCIYLMARVDKLVARKQQKAGN
ncbi:MAG TPA: MFS transporter [Bacteroidia bacterium]|nr:MFS transporter [Bacteroidia bacterium]